METKLQTGVRYLYLILMSHLVVCFNLMIGLGIFGVLPAWMVTFELYDRVRDSHDIARLKIVPFVWERSRYYGRRYYRESMGLSLVLGLLLVNIFFFMSSGHVLAFAGALISLILCWLVATTGLIAAYLGVHYSHLSGRQLWQNALALCVVKAGELLLVFGCLLGVLLAVGQINLGILLMTGFGIISMSYQFVLRYLISKNFSIFQKHAYWRKEDE